MDERGHATPSPSSQQQQQPLEPPPTMVALPTSLPTQIMLTPRPNNYNPLSDLDPKSPSVVTPMDSSSPPPTPGVVAGGGSEKVGRWSADEHNKFLQGLEKHGKQWKTIATMIGTRTVVQVRTHAQKYFQKMERKGKPKDVVVGVSSTSSHSHHSTSAALKETVAPPPHPPVTKRKSLPASLPSRKKPRTPKSKTRVSISLARIASASSPPPPEMPFTPASSGSLENLSTISPAGVADLDIPSCWPNMTTKDNADGGATAADVVMMAGGDDEDDPEDALTWLCESHDGVMKQLPRSSLEDAPCFPEFEGVPVSDDSTADGGVAFRPSSIPPDHINETTYQNSDPDPCTIEDDSLIFDSIQDADLTMQSLLVGEDEV